MKLFRTISSIVLAFLVLVSSTTFAIGFHFCMGEVQHVALFSGAESCKKQKDLPPCHRNMKPACCADETVIHDGNDFKASVDQLQLAAPSSIEIEHTAVVIAEVVPSSPVAKLHHVNYDPPLRSCDITVEHHAFLI